MKREGRTVRLRVCCLQPPDPARHDAEFGLQEKQPGDWVLHRGQRFRNGDVHFECECRVTILDDGKPPDFAGLFVQGKRGERFLYLSWKPKGWHVGEPEPGPPACVRRMKVHCGRSLRNKSKKRSRVTMFWRQWFPARPKTADLPAHPCLFSAVAGKLEKKAELFPAIRHPPDPSAESRRRTIRRARQPGLRCCKASARLRQNRNRGSWP